jgi:predicted Zn-dependent protease with MMP-like domain
MITIDEAWDILEEAAEELPKEFFESLNGGVSLVPESKRHPDSGGLYILGEYHDEPMGMGSYIILYFGSFQRVCAGMSYEEIRQELRKTLRHEFTHHVESLAGVNDLARRDEEEMDAYFG